MYKFNTTMSTMTVLFIDGKYGYSDSEKITARLIES